MERQSFLFRKEWCDAASGLRPNLRQEFLEAVISYGLTGEVPQGLGEVVRFAFGIAKAVIDRDNEELAKHEVALNHADTVVDKQQHISDVRREAQKKSVEARKSNKDSFAKIANASFANFAKDPSLSHSNSSIDNINNQDNINNKKIEEKKESKEKETKKKPTAVNATTTADFNVNSTANGHKDRNLQSRKDEFEKSLGPFIPVYGKEMVQKFFSYWSESNPSKTKMRWELQKTWETPRRLRYWASRENQFTTNSSKFKVQDNGNQQQHIDPRRGTPARQHTLEEFLAKD